MTVTLRRFKREADTLLTTGFTVLQIDGAARVRVGDPQDANHGRYVRVDDDITESDADAMASSGIHVQSITCEFKYS